MFQCSVHTFSSHSHALREVIYEFLFFWFNRLRIRSSYTIQLSLQSSQLGIVDNFLALIECLVERNFSNVHNNQSYDAVAPSDDNDIEA